MSIYTFSFVNDPVIDVPFTFLDTTERGPNHYLGLYVNTNRLLVEVVD